MTKFFRIYGSATFDFRIEADTEEEATQFVADAMRYAEIDPYQIVDWEIDSIEESIEEDE